MTSKLVSALLVDLGVTRTHSRPRVSNDNPFSEAQFKTLKYLDDFPASFDHGPGRARVLRRILHRVRPRPPPLRNRLAHPVHFGTAAAVDDARRTTLNAA